MGEDDVNTKKDIEEKAQSIREQLSGILEDDGIELAFCIFTIKDSPEQIVAEKGHFYDITRMLASMVRQNHDRMQSEVGL